METFFAVMTYGTVTQAAARLGVTQPSVTLTLRQAERDIGFALFDRQGGRLIPTTEAHALYEEVARLNTSLTAIKNLCEQLKKGDVTQLRIVAAQTLIETIIPSAVAKFAVEQHGIDIEASTLSSNKILEEMDLRSDAFDVGFIFGDARDRGVYSVQIGECPICCVAPAQWILKRKKGESEIDLRQFDGSPHISLNEIEPVGRAGRSLQLAAGIRSEILVRAQNHRLAGELAARGLGYALLDSLSAYSANIQNDLQVIPVKDSQPIAITAVVARSNNLTRTVRKFIDVFTSEFEQISQLTAPRQKSIRK